MTALPVGQLDGWTMARSGALLLLSYRCGSTITAEAAAALGQQLNGWARDPDLYAVVLEPSSLQLRFDDVEADAGAAVADLIWRLECFSKPIVSLMGEAVGDVGLAFAVAGTHRACGEAFTYSSESSNRFRLPPGNVLRLLAQQRDVGLATLHGANVDAATAMSLGLATHAIPASTFDPIRAALAAADPVDPLLDVRHVAPQGKPIGATSSTNARFTALAEHAMDAITKSAIDDAIAITWRHDEALRALGPTATVGDTKKLAREHSLPLPSRRELQAFRKT